MMVIKGQPAVCDRVGVLYTHFRHWVSVVIAELPPGCPYDRLNRVCIAVLKVQCSYREGIDHLRTFAFVISMVEVTGYL